MKLDRPTFLFLVLAGFFLTNALMAEFIGVKIFSLEATFGSDPFEWSLFGFEGTLNFTAGVLLWPVVFIMTDIINEFYGKRGVKLLSYLAVGLILYAFLFAFLAIELAPAGFWVGIGNEQGVPNMDAAFAQVFGQGMRVIIGSVVAFLIGQLIDVMVFHRLRKWTGEKHVWLRATGSTAVSQLIDSFVVLYIAFGFGAQAWPIEQIFAIGVVNYIYKMTAAIVLTPAIYLSRRGIIAYLGEETAAEMTRRAAA